jgi:hypothetical protein
MRFPTFYPDQITINDYNDTRLRNRIHVFYFLRSGSGCGNIKFKGNLPQDPKSQIRNLMGPPDHHAMDLSKVKYRSLNAKKCAKYRLKIHLEGKKS